MKETWRRDEHNNDERKKEVMKGLKKPRLHKKKIIHSKQPFIIIVCLFSM